MTSATDLELLGLQAEGALDPAGRLAGQYGTVIACAPGAHALWIGTEVPDAAAAELAAAFAATAPARDPAAPPPALDRCRWILEAGRAIEQHPGPRYVFPDAVPPRPGVLVERSDRPGRDVLRGANPGNWESVEWDELLDGRLGPWTMVLDGLPARPAASPAPLCRRASRSCVLCSALKRLMLTARHESGDRCPDPGPDRR